MRAVGERAELVRRMSKTRSYVIMVKILVIVYCVVCSKTTFVQKPRARPLTMSIRSLTHTDTTGDSGDGHVVYIQKRNTVCVKSEH